MYKTRGKPEDAWNKAAVQREKDLADAIHINQIRRNGNVQELQKFTWSPTNRQKELTRLRNNFEQYEERIKKPNMHGRSLKDLRGTSATDSSNDRPNTIKRFVSGRLNDVRSNDDTTGCHKPAMLRAPLRTVKTIKVEVPVRYKEAAIFCPLKSWGGESWSQKLREIEKLQEKLCGSKKMTNEEGVQTDLVKELTDATIEVDIGNAQLEEINKILIATKSHSPFQDDGNSGNTLLYNVQNPQQTQTKVRKRSENNAYLNKNKLLLTLNNVSERIQKLQAKFFDDPRPQYRSVKSRYRSNKLQQQLEMLCKNVNYPHSHSRHEFAGSLSKRAQQNLSLSASEKDLNQFNAIKNESSSQYEPVPVRTPYTVPTIIEGSGRESPRFFEIPLLNISGDDSFVEEYRKQSSNISDNQYSPTIFINSHQTKTQRLDNLDEIREVSTEDDNNEDTTTESLFKPKLQETILKSDFLMKEFNINSTDMCFDMSKMSQILESNTSNKKNVDFIENARQNLRREETFKNYKNARNNSGFSNSTAHYILKNTLYDTDEQ